MPIMTLRNLTNEEHQQIQIAAAKRGGWSKTKYCEQAVREALARDAKAQDAPPRTAESQ